MTVAVWVAPATRSPLTASVVVDADRTGNSSGVAERRIDTGTETGETVVARSTAGSKRAM